MQQKGKIIISQSFTIADNKKLVSIPKKQYCFYERTITMKKLAYFATAVLAGLGFTSTSSADVTVGGSQVLMYTSSGSTTKLINYGTVDFGLSATTSTGMTISSGAGLSLHDGGTAATTSDAVVYGWDGLTFGAGGVSIEIGTDVAVADGVGEVDGIHASDATMDHSGVVSVTNTVGITNDEGAGVGLTTSMGGATVSLAYVADTDTDGDSSERIDDATGTAMSVKVSTAMGPVGVTGAYVSHSDTSVDDTESAIALSYSTAMGDITVGYGNSTGAKKGNVLSGAYTVALDSDTSLAIGYASYDVASTTGTEMNVSISRGLGGGASVFMDFGSVDGTTGSGDTSVFAVGTSVSF